MWAAAALLAFWSGARAGFRGRRGPQYVYPFFTKFMDAPNAGERTGLVTEGARGIGRAIAERLAESGWQVIAIYLTGLDEAKELARTHDVQIRQIDLTDRAKTVDFSQQICAEFPLTVLVNNAGFLEKEPFEE